MRPFHVLQDASMELVNAAVDGDEAAFDALARRHRDALHAHCRRVLGRSADVDDAVQETLLRAWRRLGTFEHRCSFGWWLRCIATRVCIDIAHRGARAPLVARHHGDRCEGHRSRADPPPADAGADAGADPAAVLAARAAVEQAYLLALRTLPERQCAVLVLRLVLHFSAAETAALVGCTVAAVNSALQRANAGLAAARASSGPAEHTPPATATERQLVRRLVDAHARGDADAVVATLLPAA